MPKSKIFKFGSFLVGSLLSVLSVFGSEHSIFSEEFFEDIKKFLGEAYSLIRNNEPVVDAIGIISFTICIGILYNYLLKFLFRGRGSDIARKATSFILSLFTVVGLSNVLRDGETFLGFYGSIIVFIIVLILLIGTYILFAKYLYNHLWETDSKLKKSSFVVLLFLGLVFIDMTLGGFIKRLYSENARPILFDKILGLIGIIVIIGLVVAVIFVIYALLSRKKSAPSDATTQSQDPNFGTPPLSFPAQNSSNVQGQGAIPLPAQNFALKRTDDENDKRVDKLIPNARKVKRLYLRVLKKFDEIEFPKSTLPIDREKDEKILVEYLKRKVDVLRILNRIKNTLDEILKVPYEESVGVILHPKAENLMQILEELRRNVGGEYREVGVLVRDLKKLDETPYSQELRRIEQNFHNRQKQLIVRLGE